MPEFNHQKAKKLYVKLTYHYKIKPDFFNEQNKRIKALQPIFPCKTTIKDYNIITSQCNPTSEV